MARHQRKRIHDQKIIERDDRGVPWNIPAGGTISDGCIPTGWLHGTNEPSDNSIRLRQIPPDPISVIPSS